MKLLIKSKSQWVLMFVLLVAFSLLGGCQKRNSQNNTQQVSQSPVVTSSGTRDFIGVIKSRNEALQTMTFVNADLEEEITLYCSKATSYVSKNNVEVASGSMITGELVDVYYDRQTLKLNKVAVSNDGFAYDGLGNIEFDQQKQTITSGDQNFRYPTDLVIVAGDSPLNIEDVNLCDEVTLYGIGTKVCSVVVTKGHGYIKPSNYANFVGGTISVGSGLWQAVTKDMLMLVREGTYNVTMRNGELTGTKNIVVTRDQETDLDMSAFKIAAKNMGTVNFKIEPSDATLSINGTEIVSLSTVKLPYGNHKITVTCDGYSDYSGVLNVQSASSTVRINLEKETAEVTTDSDGTDISDDSSSSSNSTTVTTDADHTMTISTPADVKVYINGTYKGTTPCSFVKLIGKLTITLSKTGYTTKSYVIDVTDDQQNIQMNFAALEESE